MNSVSKVIFKEKLFFPYRMAFTCSFCKFRTFEEKDIELHLESSSHQETLDHIQKQTKFDKVVMEFLHVSSCFEVKSTLSDISISYFFIVFHLPFYVSKILIYSLLSYFKISP